MSARVKDRADQVTGGCEEEESMRFGGGGGRGGVEGPLPEGKAQGLALRWNEKGFGFIKPDDGGEDLFCHFSQIEDGNALREGTTVHYVKQYDEMKGKDRAVKVVGGIQEPRGGIGGGGGGYGGGGDGGGGSRRRRLRRRAATAALVGYGGGARLAKVAAATVAADRYDDGGGFIHGGAVTATMTGAVATACCRYDDRDRGYGGGCSWQG